MATVHPSRLGLVPQSLPPKPAAVSPSDSISAAAREEELRRKLLERRKEKERSMGLSDGREELGKQGNGHSEANTHTEKVETRDMGMRIRRRSPTPPSREQLPSPPPRAQESSPPRRLRMDDPHDQGESSRRHEIPPHSRERRREEVQSPAHIEERPPHPLPSHPPYQTLPMRRDLPPHSGSTVPPPVLPPFPPNMPKMDNYGSGPRLDDSNQRAPPPWRDPSRGVPTLPPRGFLPGPGSGPGSLPGSGYNTPPTRGGYRGGYDFERRRQERELNPLSIWPPSPKEPYVDPEDTAVARKSKRKSKKSKSKHRRRYSDTESSSDSDDDSEEDRRRRRRKAKIREKERERRRRYASESESEDEADSRRQKRRARDRDLESRPSASATPDRYRSRSRSESRYRSKSRSQARVSEKEEDEAWIEKDGGRAVRVSSEALRIAQLDEDESDEGETVGPRLPVEYKDKMGRTHYTGEIKADLSFRDMLPGEAEAMAAFAASGARIPRRGEIGIDSRTIEQFEQSGFVMSGSRHKRMNAVRMRKENQVINAEEKRAILVLQREERERKEGAIVASFKEMMEDNLVKQGLKKD